MKFLNIQFFCPFIVSYSLGPDTVPSILFSNVLKYAFRAESSVQSSQDAVGTQVSAEAKQEFSGRINNIGMLTGSPHDTFSTSVPCTAAYC
jgi:hypothetical protein